jgi:hypothetical protein
MRTLLAKGCVLALIAGGFVFTGDIGRVFARGRKVLEATTIPGPVSDPQTPPLPPAFKTPTPSALTAPDGSLPEASPAPDPVSTLPSLPVTAAAAPPADAPIGTRTTVSAPPIHSPESVDLGALGPGDRIVVWVGRRGGRTGAPGCMTIAFDVIDPTAAEVLEQRHAGTGDDGVNHAPYRRIRILGSATEGFLGGASPSGPSGRITRRQSLRVIPVEAMAAGGGIAPDAVETMGPVQAISVVPAATIAP